MFIIRKLVLVGAGKQGIGSTFKSKNIMSLSCGLSLGLHQSHSQGKEAYIREALKAFRKLVVDGKVFYTCNVARLKSCNRLGEEKDVALWRTHFFLCSPHFVDIDGVIFNARPGGELASFVKRAQISTLYLAMGPTEILDVATGVHTVLQEMLVFASDEAPHPEE